MPVHIRIYQIQSEMNLRNKDIGWYLRPANLSLSFQLIKHKSRKCKHKRFTWLHWACKKSPCIKALDVVWAQKITESVWSWISTSQWSRRPQIFSETSNWLRNTEVVSQASSQSFFNYQKYGKSLILLNLLPLIVVTALGVNVLWTPENIGTTRYQEFVSCVLEECSISIHDPPKKNSVAIFKESNWKITSKQGKKKKILQNNLALFAQLNISMHSRNSDLTVTRYSHVLHLYLTFHLPNTKSDLLKSI